MTVDECRAYYADNEPRGEFCICLEPKAVEVTEKSAGNPKQLIALLKGKGMSSKDIASVVSEFTGMNKKEAYKIASES